MAGIDVKAIKELRERTQAGMGDCKNALTEADGDIEKAVEIILKKGLAKSAKRAGAIAAEGEVRASVAADNRAATIVEVNIQTDFAARNEQFREFVGQVLTIAEKAPVGQSLDEQPLGDKTVGETAIELGARLGEKIAARRWDRLAIPFGSQGLCHAYVHMGGKIGVVLAIEAESAEAAEHPDVRKLADDTAMHIAAMNPLALVREDIDEQLVAKQRDIFEGQLREEPKPKPEKIWPQIIEGKLRKWFAEVVLLDQESVVTPGKKFSELFKEVSQTATASVQLRAFLRYEKGEGITKKEDDFVEDVGKMLT